MLAGVILNVELMVALLKFFLYDFHGYLWILKSAFLHQLIRIIEGITAPSPPSVYLFL